MKFHISPNLSLMRFGGIQFEGWHERSLFSGFTPCIQKYTFQQCVYNWFREVFSPECYWFHPSAANRYAFKSKNNLELRPHKYFRPLKNRKQTNTNQSDVPVHACIIVSFRLFLWDARALRSKKYPRSLFSISVGRLPASMCIFCISTLLMKTPEPSYNSCLPGPGEKWFWTSVVLMQIPVTKLHGTISGEGSLDSVNTPYSSQLDQHHKGDQYKAVSGGYLYFGKGPYNTDLMNCPLHLTD